MLKKLKNDKRINDKYINTLIKEGYTIGYGTLEYWNNIPYILLHNKKIWLMEYRVNKYTHSAYVDYRSRNSIVNDINKLENIF